MSEPFIAEIIMFGSNFAPRNWAFCDGQLLAISSNTALFSLLGTTYGGDGRTTFALPDLRGRVPVHPGTGPGLPQVRLGERGGANTAIIGINNMPSHSHALNAVDDTANQGSPDGTKLAQGTLYSSETADATLASTTIGNSGGGQAINIRQPYLGIHFIIALTGVFPSRNIAPDTKKASGQAEDTQKGKQAPSSK